MCNIVVCIIKQFIINCKKKVIFRDAAFYIAFDGQNKRGLDK